MILHDGMTVENPLVFGPLWPEEIRNNRELTKQIRIRKELCECLDFLFREMPDVTTDISEAVSVGFINQGNLSAVYNLLVEFLEADDLHARSVFYLPFELLCAPAWRPPDDKLTQAVARFSNLYMSRWKELLMNGNDVRANFVDGDILEEELSTKPPPLVRKAAHLIPVLVGKGLLSASEVVTVLHDSSDVVLRESIFDALPVLADLSLLPLTEWRRLLFSKDREVKDMVLSMVKRLEQEGGGAEFSSIRDDLDNLALCLVDEIRDIETYLGSEKNKNIPKARMNWEKKLRQEAVIAKYAKRLTYALVGDTLPAKNLFGFVASQDDPIISLVGIRGIGRAAEILNQKDPERARRLRLESDYVLRELWQRNSARIQDALTSLWARWTVLGIIGCSQLKELGIEMPKFDSEYSIDQMFVIEKEVRELTPALQVVETDPKVSRFLYPVVIVFGSRLKGYATSEADLDLAVFVRPGVLPEDRPQLQEWLRRIFSDVTRTDGKVVEFWLIEENGGMRVRNFVTTDSTLADSTWAHILFEGIWYGKKDSVKDLYEKLLSGYIFSANKKISGRDARAIWLKEMEREVLQYRLMHSGYHRYYPERGGIFTKHAGGIDPQSAFWDSGYRRVATKLFLQRVFLPRLEKPT